MLRRGQSQAKTAAKLIMIESSEAKGADRELKRGQLADESIELIVIEKFYNYNYMQLLSCSLSLCVPFAISLSLSSGLSLATLSALLTSIDEHKVARPQVN